MRQGSCGIEVAAGADIPPSIIPVATRMSQRLEAASERRSGRFADDMAGRFQQVLCAMSSSRIARLGHPHVQA